MSKVNTRNNKNSFNFLTSRNFDYKSIEEVYKLNFSTQIISQKDNKKSIIKINNKNIHDLFRLQHSINIVKKIIPNIAELMNMSNKKEKIKDRIINQEKERLMKNKIKQIIEERKKIKKSISENYLLCQKLDDKISDYNLSLYVHSKMSEKPILLTRNKNVKINPNLENIIPKDKKIKINKSLAMKFDFNRRLKILQERLNKRNEEISNVKKNLSETLINKNEILSKIKNLEKEKNELKNIKNNIEENLYFHYLNNLRQGKDTRNQGLTYMVKEILNLDKRVLLSYFPDYLDFDSINYILNQAKLKLKLEDENKQIKKLRSYFSNTIKLNNTYQSNNKSEKEFHKGDTSTKQENNQTQKLNSFNKWPLSSKRNKNNNKNNNLSPNHNEFLRFASSTGSSFSNFNNKVNFNKTQNEFNVKDNKNSKKNKENYINLNNFSDITSPFNHSMKNNFYKKLLLNQKKNSNTPSDKKINLSNICLIPKKLKLRKVEEYLKKKKSLIKDINTNKINEYFSKYKTIKSLKDNFEENKKNEMERIFKKYLKKHNSQKFTIEKEKVLSALIGEDNAQQELRRQKRQENLLIGFNN